MLTSCSSMVYCIPTCRLVIYEEIHFYTIITHLLRKINKMASDRSTACIDYACVMLRRTLWVVCAVSLAVRGSQGATVTASPAKNGLRSPSASCPCADDSALCEVIKTLPKKELFTFRTSGDTWKKYDWSKITTVAMFGEYDPELMCYAHSKGARLVATGTFPVANLTSPQDRAAWVKQQVAMVADRHMDGYNIDFESHMDQLDSHYLISLVEETTFAFHAANPYSQVTFDVPYAPGCTWNRCYDYRNLAASCDFLVIMDYDLIEGNGPFACSNDMLRLVRVGIESFQLDGVPANKLVSAAPWYGYDFPCTHLLKDNICSTIAYHQKVGKTQRFGQSAIQRSYSVVTKMLKNSTTGRIFNETQGSPFFNYVDQTTGNIRQVWYDDPASLTLRYDYARSQNLRGVGMWQADTLDYSDDPEAKNLTKAMWDAINTFFQV